MATSTKIKVMISSRCNDPFPAGTTSTLTDARRGLKKLIEGTRLFGKPLFEVWINEDAPPTGGTWDSWETCMEAVADCDILLVLYNGNAGWADDGGIGICHAEMMAGLATSPGKVHLIELSYVKGSKPAEIARNAKFKAYVDDQNLFRGGAVATLADLDARVGETLHAAAIKLIRSGVRETGRGKFHSGAALSWSRLDFQARQAAMVEAVRAALAERKSSVTDGAAVFVSVAGDSVCCLPAAIPGALTVPAAREMVGQPFLRDHETVPLFGKRRAGGPVHIVACQKSVSEAQAMRLLGFPDATVVSAPFGIYVADDVQKIQMVLIANCRDETTTRHGVQRFFDWLGQTGEDAQLVRRAKSRKKIVDVIADER